LTGLNSKNSVFSSQVPANAFYNDDEDCEDSDGHNDELLKRKKAWAELEREQDEVKRNIKSILKTAPESRVMDDPILAERVRGVRYEPIKYDFEDKVKEDKKTAALKETIKKEETAKSLSNGAKATSAAVVESS
jgi:hypothetical protein